MKTYWIDVIDDFLFEKSVNQWLSPKTIRDYCSIFNHFLNCDYIIYNKELNKWYINVKN